MQKGIVTKSLLSLVSFSLISIFAVSTVFAQSINSTGSTNPSNANSLQQEIDALQAAGLNAPQLPSGYSDISLSITSTPTTPGPDQQVTMSATSYSTDLSKAKIIWYVNGVSKENATGDTTFQFSTGNIGTQTTVKTVVDDIEGNTTVQSITFDPGDIDLLWQADSYTPPFYEGKALYPDQGTVKVIAIPSFMTTSGTKIDPKNLTYTWKRNGSVLTSDSGYGKDSLTISDNVPQGPTTIDVTVSTLGGSITAEKAITIQSQTDAPQVIFYQEDPLLGVEYQNALVGNFNLTQTEATIAAIPYFFSTASPIASVNYKWSLNGGPVANQTGNLITIRNQNSSGGSALLNVALMHTQDQFQATEGNLTIQFGMANN